MSAAITVLKLQQRLGLSSACRASLARTTQQRGLQIFAADQITIVEVGPRDGLQNEQTQVPTQVKVELINRLAEAGVGAVEATSFVSPKWVPQLADSAEVMSSIVKLPGVRYPVLTPNMKGLERAAAAGVKEVAVFPAATEAFSMKNLNASIPNILACCREVVAAARDQDIAVRGYVSCALGCPYQGKVNPQEAAKLAGNLYDMGCYEVSMGDTIGVATPASTAKLFQACQEHVPLQKLAAHMHDTYGQALANILTCLQMGITVFDTSIAGLGGCPFAMGATGNVATEDVVYMLNGFGLNHGINLDKLLAASSFITGALGKQNNSRAATAMLAAQA
ncbi:hypothetical protein WJX74_003122 [Apatococcus lobatus]|uniref:hydroxymethylglutaryl-CoA lyase n=1 Tax=Apatococcus lobatus TaxID=904363 RepID=A0AAW1RZB9_9CHLO